MSSFFEQELRKLFGDGKTIPSIAFSGRTCFGTLGGELRVRAEFVSSDRSNLYDALNLTVLGRTKGELDTLLLRLQDIWGEKTVSVSPHFQKKASPRILAYNGEIKWDLYQPDAGDYQALREAAARYLDIFRDRQQERTQDGPKLVYICAPLRGDVEKNIEFARQKAQEVFQVGDIPVCPHLMFPPIVYPENPQQDQSARDMGLRLVESCQEVHVYGPEWTEGMWAEIRHAMDLGIEVKTDQETIGRSPPRRQAQRQDKKNGRCQHER